MLDEKDSPVMITEEACNYLGISRPTYFKYLSAGKIKGIRVGKGWRVLKSELDRFLNETTNSKSSEIGPPKMSPQTTIQKSDPEMPKTILRLRVVKKTRIESSEIPAQKTKTRIKNCLKCGHKVILEEGFFLCESCRKSNSLLEDLGSLNYLHLSEAVRTSRSGQMDRNL